MAAIPEEIGGHNLLAGKKVVVTAAAGTGIGFATARRALLEGADVLVSDFHERRLGETVDKLAAEAGVSVALVYYHFKDRDGVLNAALDHVNRRAETYTEPAHATADPRARLEQLLLLELQDSDDVRTTSIAWGELRASAVFTPTLREPLRATTEDWDGVADVLSEAARGVEKAGADFLMLCTTTFHRVAEQVEAAVDIPLLHLADVVAESCLEKRMKSVAMIGTSFAMSRTFFTDRIASHGLEVQVPPEDQHDMVNAIIYNELVHGKLLDSSRRKVVKLIDELWEGSANGVILGCTELELLVEQADVEVPLFPSTSLHVAAALDRAL